MNFAGRSFLGRPAFLLHDFAAFGGIAPLNLTQAGR
jgi:hypothetical protein